MKNTVKQLKSIKNAGPGSRTQISGTGILRAIHYTNPAHD